MFGFFYTKDSERQLQFRLYGLYPTDKHARACRRGRGGPAGPVRLQRKNRQLASCVGVFGFMASFPSDLCLFLTCAGGKRYGTIIHFANAYGVNGPTLSGVKSRWRHRGMAQCLEMYQHSGERAGESSGLLTMRFPQSFKSVSDGLKFLKLTSAWTVVVDDRGHMLLIFLSSLTSTLNTTGCLPFPRIYVYTVNEGGIASAQLSVATP